LLSAAIPRDKDNDCPISVAQIVARTQQRLGPYSRSLRRGVIGASLDGRSEAGRYARDLERQLTDHVGGSPSITQRLLIERIIKTGLQLRGLDAKLAADTWTDCDARTHGGLVNRERLLLRELGLKPQPAPVPTLAEHLARKAAERERGVAA
jgi:hypothetical protein